MTLRDGLQLPVHAIADEVNQTLRRCSSLVVTAPPGAGKSTLLPLTILQQMPPGERIIMLEPRRIAARQVAERMAHMLGQRVGQTVGYRVRLDHCTGPDTRIEVVTEGILTRMMVDDPTLEGVGLLIFDEYHERSMATDVALALARETQSLLRPELRILLMSATIDTTALCAALQAPLIEAQGRMFPVQIERGEEEADATNCAQVTARAILQAHREQQGDILAFLPGQGEILRCHELLQQALPATRVATLYGAMPFEAQQQAIAPTRDGCRRVVLATPIAETSLTIEGISVVVDSGLCRLPVYEPRTGLTRLQTVRISHDMATQRMGRAGRLQQGVCYRLWSLATEHRMALCREPEILQADLAGMLLDVTAWGQPDAASLPWMTPPPREALCRAAQLLTLLGAVQDTAAQQGGMPQLRLMPHGRRMAALPCHPRMAQMLMQPQADLAADIAALLGERDIMADAQEDADLCSRLSLLRQARRRGGAGRMSYLLRIAEQYCHLAHTRPSTAEADPYEVGRLLALAYPERVAHHEGGERYRMASGDTATLSVRDPLAGHPWLAVASVGSRIQLAAPAQHEHLMQMAQTCDFVDWDNRQGAVRCQREWRMGVHVLQSRPLHDVPQEQVVDVICRAVARQGLSMLTFDDEVRRLQLRIACLAQWHPEMELPPVDDATLLSTAHRWLACYIGTATTTAALRRIPLCPAILSLLSYDQQQALEQLAPTHITLPTGRRVRVDYRPAAQAPVVSVRLQDCFGLTDTPRLDHGRRPVLMELLSPGFKPVQLTQDLASFWATTYYDVRRELRRRYPKHAWPEDPLAPV